MSAWKEWVSEYKNARRAPASTVRNRPWPGKKKRPWKLWSETYSYTVGYYRTAKEAETARAILRRKYTWYSDTTFLIVKV